MKIGSLFTGTGMLDQAVKNTFAAEIAWHADPDPASQHLLQYHYPDTPNWGDITQIDWHKVEPIDILVGGFPCQDLSSAGLRAGISQGTRSGLWESYAHAIDTLMPGLVVIENVRGILSAKAHRNVEPGTVPMDGQLRALGRVLGDLSSIGYDTKWVTVRASASGAPHRRERVFIVSYPHRRGLQIGTQLNSSTTQDPTDGDPRWGHSHGCDEQAELTLLHTPAARDGSGLPPHPNYTSLVSDAWQLSGREFPPGWERKDERGEGVWGKYESAVRRWEQVTRPAPWITEPNRDGKPRLNAKFAEWMMGWPEGWVTEVPNLTRVKTLKLIGNGVCYQQAVSALTQLVE